MAAKRHYTGPCDGSSTETLWGREKGTRCESLALYAAAVPATVSGERSAIHHYPENRVGRRRTATTREPGDLPSRVARSSAGISRANREISAAATRAAQRNRAPLVAAWRAARAEGA